MDYFVSFILLLLLLIIICFLIQNRINVKEDNNNKHTLLKNNQNKKELIRIEPDFHPDSNCNMVCLLDRHNQRSCYWKKALR